MRNISLNIRTTDNTKMLLQQAADLLGVTVSSFLLNTATEKACKLIESQNHFYLKEEQWKKLSKALDKEGSDNKKLGTLFNKENIFKGE